MKPQSTEKELEDLNYSCNLKKKELDNYIQEISKRGKDAERLYSSLKVKIDAISQDILLMEKQREDAEIKLSGITGEVEAKRKELASFSREIAETKQLKRDLDGREAALNALNVKLAEKAEENNRASDLIAKERNVMSIDAIEIIKNMESVSRRLVDASKAEKRAEEVQKEADKDKKGASDLIKEAQAKNDLADEKLAEVKAKLDELESKEILTNKFFEEADKARKEAEKLRLENVSIQKGLIKYRQELEDRKLQIDAIIQRKNIDEKQLGKKK